MSRFWESTMAAITAFRTTWSGDVTAPPTVRNQYTVRDATYHTLWGYYGNMAYTDLARMWRYTGAQRVYKHTRPLYNPVRRLVDAYASLVWPGVLTVDEANMARHIPIATPLSEGVGDDLRVAIGQLYQWTNFANNRFALVRYGACLGNVMVEIIDDVEGGKVAWDILWPGFVTDLDLDYSGFVKRYAIEYEYEDRDDNRTYRYKRLVDGDAIRTFRDGEPYSFNGAPAAYDNPYGFAPAVWVPHTTLGGLYAAPAIRNVDKIDELNSLVSHLNDHTHKILNSPVILAMHNPEAALPEPQDPDNPDVIEMPSSTDDPDRIAFIEANVGARAEAIQLPQGQALEHVQALLGEVERDHPELAMWNRLREMTDISGAAAERLFGDVLAYVREAQASYDANLIRLIQMSTAIGGMRFAEGAGGWVDRTWQQVKFRPFSLDSYKAGNMEFYIKPRPLVPLTEMEAMQAEILQAQVQRLQMELVAGPMNGGEGDRDVQVQLPRSIYGRLRGIGQNAGGTAQSDASRRGIPPSARNGADE